jgi:perosamine synthetase
MPNFSFGDELKAMGSDVVELSVPLVLPAFDPRDRVRLLSMWDGILKSRRWTEGPYTTLFEKRWAEWNGLNAVAFSSWGGAAMAALEFIDVRGKGVLCPSNANIATALSVLKAGGLIRFVDCNRSDLCMSFEDFRRRAEDIEPKAAWLVHIGGHLAFDVEEIARYCRRNGIWLLEDCAHAHGAEWYGRRPGTWGDVGVYSFHATKTISTGEGGMLVSKNENLLAFAKKYRTYGGGDPGILGLNYRITEFAAAMGVVQTERLEDIVARKNEFARLRLESHFPDRIRLPDGMRSGLYKFVVFSPVARSTGKVYARACHRILGEDVDLPNSDWVSANHWCVPVPYQPAVL